MSNQYFSLSRFGRLLRQHVQAHIGSYALQAIVLLGGILAVLGGLSYLQRAAPVAEMQKVFMLLFVVGAGSYFASTGLAGYGQGSRAALGLLLPASQWEKFLLAWLLSGPLFLVVFLADFYLADWLIVSLSRPPGVLYSVLAEPRDALGMLGSFVLVQGLGLWGSIYFRQQQFVRTAFLVFGALVVLNALNFKFLQRVVSPNVRFATMFSDLRLGGAEEGLPLHLPATSLPWLAWLPLALAALLWAAAYARLTEKQL